MCAFSSTWDSSKKTTAWARLHTLDCRYHVGQGSASFGAFFRSPPFNPSKYHMPYSDIESGNAHFAHSNYLHIYERTSKRDTEVAQGPFSSDTTPEEVQLGSTWILASQISRFFGSTTLLFQFHTRFRHIFSYRPQFASLAASCIALSSN